MKTQRINGSFLLLLIVSFTVTLFTVSIFAKTFPLIFAKTLYFCQQFISNNLFQIPQTIPGLLLLILAIALILSGLSFSIQVLKTEKFVNRLFLRRVPLSKKEENIVNYLGLRKKVHLIQDRDMYSFCAGIFRPKIIITTGLISSLKNRELEAVFLHEKAHMENHDPLKMLFGKTVSWLFFFLPIFSEISRNMEATSEMSADLHATNFQREDTYLRSALKKIILTPQVALLPVPAIANPDYLEIRIHRLVNPAIQQSFRISWKSIVTSLLFFLLSIFVLQTPVSAFSMENNKEEPSYFMCSGDNACQRECSQNAQISPVTTPEELFSTPKGAEKFSSQTPQSTAPLYK